MDHHRDHHRAAAGESATSEAPQPVTTAEKDTATDSQHRATPAGTPAAGLRTTGAMGAILEETDEVHIAREAREARLQQEADSRQITQAGQCMCTWEDPC